METSLEICMWKQLLEDPKSSSGRDMKKSGNDTGSSGKAKKCRECLGTKEDAIAKGYAKYVEEKLKGCYWQPEQ